DKSDLHADEQRVLTALEQGVGQVDDLALRLDCTVADALSVLTSLELKGLVSQDRGRIFRPTLDVAVQPRD
ncbi:MAG: hypothetical protein OEZ42_01905, partial [Gemmatimonadota bacterium]|nr:hypothetical protein [Gemmatimonadota bacterium]